MLIEEINKEPVNKIIKDINSSRASTILLGPAGCGKTTVLKTLTGDKNNLVIDGSVKDGEFLHLYQKDIFNLYHMALLVQKMILYIQKRYPLLAPEFGILKTNISTILNEINDIYVTNSFFEEIKDIDSYFIEYPEVLLEWYLNILFDHFDIDTITVFLDRFDSSNYSNRYYQRFMYNTLNKYLKVIISVSDTRIVKNYTEIRRLQKNNQVISITYNQNVAIVKDILDRMIINSGLLSKKDIFNKRVYNLLSDDLIEILIKRTNGNIFMMSYMVRELYRHLDELTADEYESFLTHLPVIYNHTLSKRKLYI